MSLLVVKADWVVKSPPESHIGTKLKKWKARVLALLLNERLQEWTLKYYKDKEMNKYKGAVTLSPATQLYRPRQSGSGSMHLFAVRPALSDRTFYFACFSRERREDWLDILSSALEVPVVEDEINRLPGWTPSVSGLFSKGERRSMKSSLEGDDEKKSSAHKTAKKALSMPRNVKMPSLIQHRPLPTPPTAESSKARRPLSLAVSHSSSDLNSYSSLGDTSQSSTMPAGGLRGSGHAPLERRHLSAAGRSVSAGDGLGVSRSDHAPLPLPPKPSTPVHSPLVRSYLGINHYGSPVPAEAPRPLPRRQLTDSPLSFDSDLSSERIRTSSNRSSPLSLDSVETMCGDPSTPLSRNGSDTPPRRGSGGTRSRQGSAGSSSYGSLGSSSRHGSWDCTSHHESASSLSRRQQEARSISIEQEDMISWRLSTLLGNHVNEEDFRRQVEEDPAFGTVLLKGLVTPSLNDGDLVLPVSNTVVETREQRQLEELKDRLNDYELPTESMKFVKKIGKGIFGEVWLAEYKSAGINFAAKLLQGEPTVKERIEFLEEAICMSRFSGNVHILGLAGVQTGSAPNMILTEYMTLGSAKAYLKRCASDHRPVELDSQLWIAFQVAIGMNYLVNVERFVHRDVAARNVFLTNDGSGRLLAKVADFGLSRSAHLESAFKEKRKHVRLPVKWMAKECLELGVYTAETDVWSYGVFLWELASDGKVPYPGVSNEQLYAQLTRQPPLRLSFPFLCPQYLHELMLKCTDPEPKSRPSFAELCFILGKRLAEQPTTDKYPIEQKLAEVHKFLPKPHNGSPGEADDSDGYVVMSKPRRRLTIKRVRRDDSNTRRDPLMTVDDIPCLSAIKDLNSSKLLAILDKETNALCETERELLRRPEIRTNADWLKRQVQILWLRRGDMDGCE